MIDRFKELISIDEETHLNYMIAHQDKGGWSEFLQEPSKHVPSPLVTAQVILGMVPYLNFRHLEHLKPKIIESVKIGTEYLLKNFYDFGWGDHLGVNVLIDASGAVLTAIVDSIQLEIVPTDNLEIVKQALNFIIQEQNDDGGWGIRKGDTSRVQFTYWVLKALKACEQIQTELKGIIHSKDDGIKWLSENLKSNQMKALSIFIGGELSPVATALGVEIFHEFSIKIDKPQIIQFFRDERIAKGRWNTQTDVITFRDIPRRVYVLNDWARILECFALLDIRFDSELFEDTLRSIRDLEVPGGGFKQKKEDINPIGWFTAQSLKAFSTLRNKFDTEFEKYLPTGVPIIKKHAFSKAILMVGRFRPPHLGHYRALQAILHGPESEFLFPHNVGKELIDVDKIFIGVTRYGIDKDNPWSTGEVREIWRQVIDNNQELKKKSHLIEIVSCPAQHDFTNVVDAIDEITSTRASVIVLSGNSRVIEQCKRSSIRYFEFKRSEEISGTRIREILLEIDFENIHNYQKLLKELEAQLHPAAFQIMMNDDMFTTAQAHMKAR